MTPEHYRFDHRLISGENGNGLPFARKEPFGSFLVVPHLRAQLQSVHLQQRHSAQLHLAHLQQAHAFGSTFAAFMTFSVDHGGLPMSKG